MLVKNDPDPQIELLETLLKLAEKTEELASRERELQKLKLERAIEQKQSATKIAELEAELARVKRMKVKKEDPEPEVIMIEDSDDENENLTAVDASTRISPKKETSSSPRSEQVRTPSVSASGPTLVDNDEEAIQSTPSTNGSFMIQESITLASRSASTRETANVPNTPSRRRNPRCKPRGQPQTTSDGDATSVKIEPKEERVEASFQVPGSKETTVGHVVVTESGAMKYEPEDDELGPEYPVPEECRDATYSREQISKVLGGGPITTTHHWTKNVQNRTESITGNTKPFITFSREWHPSLPTHPGGHGTAVGNLFIKSPDNPQPVPVFVREKKNHWRPMGIYDGQKVGIITPEGIARMSRDIVDTWSHAIATKSWGKARIEEANDNLLKNQRKIVRTKEDIRAALGDGRLKLHFTVLKCVGYPHDWFKSLEDYRKKEEREKQVKGEEVDEDDEEEEEEEDIFRGTPTREMPRSTSSRKRKTRHWAAAAEVKSEPDDSDDSDFEFEAVKKRPRRQR